MGYRRHPPICGRGERGCPASSGRWYCGVFFWLPLLSGRAAKGGLVSPEFRFRECRTYDRHQIIYSYDRVQKYVWRIGLYPSPVEGRTKRSTIPGGDLGDSVGLAE
ncbi:MAG: hypothetical protein HN548_03420, partial [Opitutae bacterium]|nr:hypothetical protein [Opitutae bacterium]